MLSVCGIGAYDKNKRPCNVYQFCTVHLTRILGRGLNSDCFLVHAVLLVFCCSELECVNVTIPVQSMVKNSQLVVPAGTQLVCEWAAFCYHSAITVSFNHLCIC